ncbi:MAG: DUF4281 domain-containing protein [Acidobacteria bacterium]|nr:DUF4281 domain-containing protein [Acidobacteriota bacterium]
MLPGWLLLAVMPAWRWTRVLAAYVIPGVLAALYLAVMLSDLNVMKGSFGSIEEVGRLFQNEWLLLAGWIHYLAFDLFVGAWQVRDAQRLEVPHLLVVPCLALTFIAGPVGLLAYFIVRATVVRKMPGTEPPTSHRRRRTT